jgi:SAM-dependent methyltransferase
MTDSTGRFSGRVADYLKYRPGYPDALLDFLRRECGLLPGLAVADVGCGTGKLSALFLSNGNAVFGVEPNAEMRGAAEALFSGRADFHSVAGKAEATTLPDDSVDMIAVGQAFHWFDLDRAALEFRRILRRKGFAVIVWNARELRGPSWADAYEGFLQEYSIDYRTAAHHGDLPEEAFGRFFAGPYGVRSFANQRSLDFKALLGCYLSSSYALTRDHARFREAEDALRALFRAHERGGRVDFSYRTQVYFGRLTRTPSR